MSGVMDDSVLGGGDNANIESNFAPVNELRNKDVGWAGGGAGDETWGLFRRALEASTPRFFSFKSNGDNDGRDNGGRK